MGLAIVRAIMTSHGGAIDLLPDTTEVSFALRMPARDAEDASRVHLK